MLLNNKFIPSNPILDVFLVQSVDSHLNIEMKPVLNLIRFFIISIIAFHTVYFWYVLYNKTNLNNIYFAKIRAWTWYIVALMVFMLIANIALIFLDNRPFWINCVTIFMLFSVLLFVLKRPAFINKSAKKLALGHKFNQEVDVEINEIQFNLYFKEQRYYTKTEASLEDFSGILKVKPLGQVPMQVSSKLLMEFIEIQMQEMEEVIIQIKYCDIVLMAEQPMQRIGE
jgi:glucan phosphoethanolaminetransferase (alkaline phosphatase superfamily)